MQTDQPQGLHARSLLGANTLHLTDANYHLSYQSISSTLTNDWFFARAKRQLSALCGHSTPWRFSGRFRSGPAAPSRSWLSAARPKPPFVQGFENGCSKLHTGHCLPSVWWVMHCINKKDNLYHSRCQLQRYIRRDHSDGCPAWSQSTVGSQ
jgi:hypothetical protein